MDTTVDGVVESETSLTNQVQGDQDGEGLLQCCRLGSTLQYTVIETTILAMRAL
jgi:hypothetical protein